MKQNIEKYLCKHGVNRDFFDRTQKHLRINENMGKLGFIKINKLFSSNYNIEK